MNQTTSWPRAVFFDVGETLVRPRRAYDALLTEVSDALGIALPATIGGGLAARIEARVTERTRQGLPFTFPAGVSQRFWFETYQGFFADILSATDARRLAQSLLARLSAPAGYVPFDDTVPTLEGLRAEGCRLGIISNWEAWLPALLDAASLTPFFNHIVISGVCGIEKPDARIFMWTMAAGRYRSGEVVYVGDRPAHDVGPARQAGMVPILLDRADRYPQHDAGARIGALSELAAALEALARETRLARMPGHVTK